MKKRWRDVGIIVLFFLLWRIVLSFIEYLAPAFWTIRQGYLGLSHWANFDGVHYVSIARAGYRQYLEAFFPLYPGFIHILSGFFPLSFEMAGLFISHIFFVCGLVLFWKLATMEKGVRPWWSMVFLLVYPMSFFFAAAYTSSMYFFLAAGTFYAAKKGRWAIAGLMGFFASATQIFGIFLFLGLLVEYIKTKKNNSMNWLWLLLVPFGLFSYMIYLWHTRGDPLAFYHVQPAFGAQRSAGGIILLPQVLWRYMKILTQSSMETVQYWVAALESGTFLLTMWLLWRGMKQKISPSYLIYSAAVIVLPTLTGTFSSLPRYFLSAFPLFFVLGGIKSAVGKIFLALLFGIGLLLAGSLFLQGYFVS